VAVAAAAVLGSAQGALRAADLGSFALVPSDDCDAIAKLCYEAADQTLLEQVRENDLFNLCKEDSTVVQGSCEDQGYGKFLAKDPFFTEVKIYAKLPSPGAVRLNSMQKLLKTLSVGTIQGVCWKPSHSRGMGHFAQECATDEEREMGMCFAKCPSGEEGMGPICWGACSADYPVSAGAFCCSDEATCESLAFHEGYKIALDIGKAALDYERGNTVGLLADLKKLYEDARELELPQCIAASHFSALLA